VYKGLKIACWEICGVGCVIDLIRGVDGGEGSLRAADSIGNYPAARICNRVDGTVQVIGVLNGLSYVIGDTLFGERSTHRIVAPR